MDAGPPKKRVFISSAKYAGDLKTAGSGSTGLDGADKLCTSLATAASLGGAWKAFLDTHNVAAATRMADVGPWFIVDATGKGKTEVFASKATLDTTEVVPNVTEIGSTLAGGENFWTGSTEVYNNCTDFTATGSVYGNETMPRAGSGWSGSAGDNVPCTTMLHIICLEQ